MKKIIFSSILVLLLSVILWIIWGNNAIQTNNISILNENIPDSFNGYKIVHISDLHNAQFGNNNEILLNKIKEADPDIIVVTGDLVDSRHTNIQVGIDFAANAQKIAPVYYVNGNHESRLSAYEDIENSLIDEGIVVLKDYFVEIKKNDDTIRITGISDPDFILSDNKKNSIDSLLSHLRGFEPDDNFNILLTHRPEYFDLYVKHKYDLVFSGHAHGGQFRIPFIGGIFSPGQGLFPEYDSGLYSKNGTSMIVSRGLGNSLFPFRLNNNPEIIIIELKNKTEVE